MNKKEIIVFDTGSGAYFIAQKLRDKIKNIKFKVITDKENAPYGNKTDRQILESITKKLHEHLMSHKYCLIACNTATVNVIDDLRIMYPNNIFFGLEPMIKTAGTLSVTRNIVMLATESTKKSARYLGLVKKYTKDLAVHSPNTSHWATLIDNQQSIDLTETLDIIKKFNCDIVILGCSHYLAIESQLNNESGLIVLEPSDAVAKVILNYLQYL